LTEQVCHQSLHDSSLANMDNYVMEGYISKGCVHVNAQRD